jgi:hypothetical protein
MEELFSKVLAHELGHLGGVGSKLVARFLSNIHYEVRIDVAAPPDEVRPFIAALLANIGRPNPLLPDSFVVCGSGHANLNPTIVSAEVAPFGAGSQVVIRAVAKEGLIKQGSAKKAVERVSELLWGKFSARSDSH